MLTLLDVLFIHCSTASVPIDRLLKIATKLDEKFSFEEMTRKLADALEVSVYQNDRIRLGYRGTYLEMFFAWERKRPLDHPAPRELASILRRIELPDLAELCM